MAQESVLRIVIDSRNAERNARNVANELQNIERNGDHASRSMDSMSVATRSLVGYMGGLVTIGAAINKMDAYTGLQNRLKLVTDSQAELNTAMNDTFGIAQKTASSWDSVAMVYQRFADNADRLNITMAQTSALTETVSKAISVSGGSAASAEAALMQFGQALASGVLRGEEFNSIAEQAPGLLKAIAFGLNTNVGSLRAMAQDGKITGDVLVDALGKAKPYIDDLFNRTDFTISQSFTKLSNEVTKFVGEAGKGSGAASALGDSIGFLANNLSTIADIAIVGGVAMLTKTILAQTVAIQGSITASVARRAADIAVLQSQVQLAVVEAQRTRNKVGELAAEQNLIVAKLRTNLATKERIALETRATQVAIQLAVAERNMTAATAQRTIAQNTLNASMSAGSRILGLVGGWTGVLTIGVAALAAGYMYLKNRTAEANAKLEEQGKVAEKTNEELTKLSGNDKKNAVSDLTAAFNAQNAELSKSKEAVDAVLFAIRASSVENEKARKVTEDAKNGVISYNQAIELLNKMDISPELYEMLKKTALQYDENSNKAGKSQKALSILGFEFTLSGNKAQNAANQVATNTEELKNNETAARDAAKAQKGYFDSLTNDVLTANERLAYMDLGFTKEVIDQINKLQEAKQKAVGDSMTAFVTTEEINQIVQAQKALDAVKNKEDEITKAKRDQTSEAEKQAKLAAKQAVIMAGSNEQTKNMLKVYQAFRSAGVDDTKARVLTAQVGREGDFLNKNLFGSHPDAANGKSNSGMISWQGSRSKSLTQYLQGQGVLDKKGNIEQTQEALNAQAKFFIQEIMTDKKYSSSKNALLGDSSNYRDLEKTFGKNAIAWDYNGKNIGANKASKNLARQDNYYNSLNKILGGDPENALSSIKDLAKYDDEAYKARKDLLDRVNQLQSQYDTEAITRSKARDEEILQATILGQTNLIPKIKDRYDAEDKLAKLQQEFDVEGHKWTEERKLQYTYDTNVLRLTAEGNFSEDQKKIFEKGLKDQYEQELGYIKLAKEQRMFQMREQFMTETAAMEERYRIEHMRLIETNDLEERNFQQQMLRLQKQEEVRNRLNNATQNWGQTQADMNGTGEQFQIEQTRFSRYDQSQELFDSQMSSLDQREQDPVADLNEIALLREQAWFAHHDRMKAIESDYQASSYSLQLGYGQQVTGALSGMFGAMLGESSSAYRALYAAQQAFVLAQASMNVWKAASDAYANEPGTVWQKMGAAALATIESGTFVSMIQAATPKGFETGGYTGSGGRKDVAGVVHGQEYVLNAAATKRVGVGTLDAINSGKSLGGGDVVNAPITVHVSVQSNGDSSVDSQGQSKQLGQMIGNAVRTVIRQEQRQGGLLSK